MAPDKPEPRRGLLGKLLRLFAFAVVLGVAGLVLLLHRAHADVKRALRTLGQNMIVFYGEDEPARPPRTLYLNGVSIKFVAGSTPHAVDKVLDFYEARCQARDGRFEELAELADAAVKIPTASGKLLDSTIRDEGDGKGFVACLDMGPDPVSVEELAARTQEFARTGDLGKIGRFRYIYAERGVKRTRFVAVWSEGEMNVLGMFPATGDAPGADPRTLPRPPRGERKLTSWEEGFPQRLYVYETPTSPAELDHFYRATLPGGGWKLLEKPPQASGLPEGSATLVAERGGKEMAVIVLAPGDDGKTIASFLIAR